MNQREISRRKIAQTDHRSFLIFIRASLHVSFSLNSLSVNPSNQRQSKSNPDGMPKTSSFFAGCQHLQPVPRVPIISLLAVGPVMLVPSLPSHPLTRNATYLSRSGIAQQSRAQASQPESTIHLSRDLGQVALSLCALVFSSVTLIYNNSTCLMGAIERIK